MPIKGAASGVVNSMATVCGGLTLSRDNSVNVVSECYQLNSVENRWIKTSVMLQSKAYAGFDSGSTWGLVVSGGFTGTVCPIMMRFETHKVVTCLFIGNF